MGAAKKVIHLEQETKLVELMEVTSSKKKSASKNKKSRAKHASKVPSDALTNVKKTTSAPKSKAHQNDEGLTPPQQAQEKQVVAQVEFSQLSAHLTRPKSLTHDQVEAALQAATIAQAQETSLPDHEATPEDHQAQTQPADAKPKHAQITAFVLVATLIILLGFYMHLNQNIQMLTQQVHDLSTIKNTVSTLDTKIGTMETRVNDLETLPSKTRAALLSSILQEMSQKTSYMSTQLETPEQQEKLMRAKELIQQVQTDLSTQF